MAGTLDSEWRRGRRRRAIATGGAMAAALAAVVVARVAAVLPQAVDVARGVALLLCGWSGLEGAAWLLAAGRAQEAGCRRVSRSWTRRGGLAMAGSSAVGVVVLAACAASPPPGGPRALGLWAAGGAAVALSSWVAALAGLSGKPRPSGSAALALLGLGLGCAALALAREAAGWPGGP